MIGNDLDLGSFKDRSGRCRMTAADRGTHLHVVGATGVGKSKFLEHLIRQDIRNHHRSGCGMLVIDRHGSLYDGLVEWLARYDPEAELPVVPIDLRQDKWVVAYNPLRPRPVPASVVAGNVVQSIAHVWGASGTSDTPRFAHIAKLLLRTLYREKLTLAEAPAVLAPGANLLRDALAARADGHDARKWSYLSKLKSGEELALFESTINRFDPFVETPLLQSIFGQTGPSLDLGRAMKRGYIILVAAASEKAKVTDEDARLFATLFLSDLWAAAKKRGKRDSVKPFYLYLDEFQEFVTPTIAKSLDQSRGFGCHLTLGHQFPKQLKNAGPHGQGLYDSIMENGQNKVVFHLSYDTPDIARSLFLGTIDPDQVKHEQWSTKVVGQHEEMRIARSHNQTTGKNRGTGTTIDKRRKDDGDEGTETGKLTAAENEIEIDTETDAETESPVMVQDFGKELSGVQFRSVEEQLMMAEQRLFNQKQRECLIRLSGWRTPATLGTPDVKGGQVSAKRIERYLTRRLRRWKFALTAEEAAKRLAEKEADIERRFFLKVTDEPEKSGWKVRG